MRKDKYKCAKCWGIFTKGWSDEECEAEYKERFNNHQWESATVCDTCYKSMTREISPEDWSRMTENFWEQCTKMRQRLLLTK